MSTVAEHIALLRERANTLERIAKNTGNPWPNHADLQSDAAFMFNAILLVSVHLDELETLAREDFRRRPASSEAAPSADVPYSDRVKCTSCENGSGPNGCTDCLNTGHDPQAFAGGVDQALNDAYAEGRKDEREALSIAARDVLAERERQQSVEGWTPEHDDEHGDHSMAVAAACYALWDARWPQIDNVDLPNVWRSTGWGESWFKPKDPRRNLIRAGALILAEVERIDRAESGEVAR